jgi:hypothetical protein
VSEALTIYLNDHFAGSVAAVELLDHLLTILPDDDRRAVLVAVRKDVEEDQEVLRRILHGVGAHESIIRKAAAWLTEKIGLAKLRLDDPHAGELHLLEALEAVGLGVQGKLALWRSLAAQQAQWPELQDLNFALLQQRAEDQHQKIEALRLRSARMALAPSR